jgi:hypothetical protein
MSEKYCRTYIVLSSLRYGERRGHGSQLSNGQDSCDHTYKEAIALI